ncbi:tol-pal system protein YbgF [Alteromonas sp. ASW11-36]|uniref:Cell division coordinator CpoB n=1 Tax=Alteromonas arenosi TaxID=3055817 RepID=A0ABT7SUT1_9ALTE|nr:tol-pal system protein YbgF [Alteromonas sp. ASW11-36]MDM7859941.1 tol-pal system protein YbgF [Alteromonas sp. ASW11-36]
MRKSPLVLASIFTVTCAAAAAQAPVVDANNGDFEARLAAIESILDSRTESQHRLQSQLDSLQSEVDELRGAVEVHTNQLEKILQRQRELYLEIDKRVEALKTATVQQPVTTPDATTQTPAVTQPVTTAISETEAYENAVNLILKDRDYAAAVPAFQQFISQYPDSEYAANAHYWLGQLLFNQQDWVTAQQQFGIVVDRFADSSKRADSILKLGIIAERQGNVALARQRFNQVVAEYPDSSARKLADSRLAQIGG